MGPRSRGDDRLFYLQPRPQTARLTAGLNAKTAARPGGRLNSFEALALIGSTAPSQPSGSPGELLGLGGKGLVLLARMRVHSSTASEGDLAPNSSCAKSRLAVVLAFMISELGGYWLRPC
jgi:hypothetical protein